MTASATNSLLDHLSANLELILERLASRGADMVRYQFLMGQIWKSDVREDAVFQRTFNGLYMVRRGAAWREAFYELFEANKKSADVSFDRILRDLHLATGRIEASFASKLLATVNAEMPVYDSWVRINMSLKLRTGVAAQRIPELCKDYAGITSIYREMERRPEYAALRHGFDRALPSLQTVSDTKKIDLLLWQSRPVGG
jgi:hypothetical protein